jgi:pre-mRNA-splicing factor SYF1
MLRIKRAVQASFNTEGSFIAAQAAAARKGASEKPTDAAQAMAAEAQDPMAAMEREANAGTGKKGGPAFVASTLGTKVGGGAEEVEAGNGGDVANPDAIEMDEDEF